jgi:hypothetical protein
MATLLDTTSKKERFYILYNAVIRSITEYCSLTYFLKLTKSQIQKLNALQRNLLIRIASGYKTASYKSINVVTGLMPVDLQLQQINEIKTLKNQKLF